MQRPDEKKRALITATAARLFATQPFHKVRLDDIAAEAKIGKGTLYIYFDSKEDLYFSLIYDGFVQLVDCLTRQIADGEQGVLPPRESLRRIVTEVVRFAFSHPNFFELMRTIGAPKSMKGRSEEQWTQKRSELHQLVEETIQRGIAAGEFDDPKPSLTALFLPGMVRAAMLFGPRGLDETEVAAHILKLVEGGICRRTQNDVS